MLFDEEDLSIDILARKCHEQKFEKDNNFMEVQITSSIHLLCCCKLRGHCMGHRQSDRKHQELCHWLNLLFDQINEEVHDIHGTVLALSEKYGLSRPCIVTVESAIPFQSPLSLAFVAHCWWPHDDKEGEADSTPPKGTRMKLFHCLAVLDFLTASPGSGAGLVAARSMVLSVNDESKCMSELQLDVHFGSLNAEIVSMSPVMQLFMMCDPANRLATFCNQLKDAACKLDDVGALFATAADCLNQKKSQ